MTRLRLLVILLIAFGFALAATAASAQAVEYSCKYFFVNVYQATDCMEALFNEDMPYVTATSRWEASRPAMASLWVR